MRKRKVLYAITGFVLIGSLLSAPAAAGTVGSIHSDTTKDFEMSVGERYCFTVTPQSRSEKIGYTVGNGSVLQTFVAGKPANNKNGTIIYCFGFQCQKEGSTGIYINTGGKSLRLFSVNVSDAIPATAKEAALYWADTLAQRDSAARFAILSDQLKQKEFGEYEKNDWTLGCSSPWVTSYTVTEKGQSASGTEYQVDYIFSDSTLAKYEGFDNITVKQVGQNWFVTQHEDLELGYPDTKEIPGQFPNVTMPPAPSALPTKTPQGTARLWAEALKIRNGAFRFACLDFDLRKLEVGHYQKSGWSIGTSSPWVVSYTTTQVSRTGDTAQYRIDYQWSDSEKNISKSSESITLKNEGGIWLVSKHDALEW